MTDPKDPEPSPLDARALIQLWREYGKRFTVFVPAHQPVPELWGPDLPERDARERTNPQYLKHWKFFGRTREFLREYYAQYQILQGPSLFFDCLVPHFQTKIKYSGQMTNTASLRALRSRTSTTGTKRLFGWDSSGAKPDSPAALYVVSATGVLFTDRIRIV
jgi:hypothetical protein